MLFMACYWSQTRRGGVIRSAIRRGGAYYIMNMSHFGYSAAIMACYWSQSRRGGVNRSAICRGGAYCILNMSHFLLFLLL